MKCRTDGSAALLRWSLPVRGAWVEMFYYAILEAIFQSLPVRGAWVEMQNSSAKTPETLVAPRAGSVG